MKRALLILLLLLPVPGNALMVMGFNPSPGPADPSIPPTVETLRWKNGETLSGDIASASSASLIWKTSFFADPLQLRWSALDRIDWPAATAPPAGPFSFTLRDGSFLYGDLVTIGPDSITIHSARHGTALLKRSEVLNARRLKRGDLLFSGPTGDVGWEPMMNLQDGGVQRNFSPPGILSPLTTGPGGALLIRAWNRSALLDLPLPDLVDLEFHVRSSRRPEFLVSLGSDVRQSLRIETWDNELVLCFGSQFKTLRTIGENDRDVALRICWDKKAQKCSVFTLGGELLVDWHLPTASPGPSSSGGLNLPRTMIIQQGVIIRRGVTIRPRSVVSSSPSSGLVVQNRGLDLTLDSLRIRAWDGKPPAHIDPRQPYLEMADGRNVSGAIVGGAPGFIKLPAAGGAAPADVPLARVDRLVFSSDPPRASAPSTTLFYQDGTLIHGRIVSVENGRASLATSFTAESLASQLDTPRQILFAPSASKSADLETSLANLDKILIDQAALHGKLESAPGGTLGWMPVGGIALSRLSQTLPSEITRSLPPAAPPPSDPALFQMSSGDVLPGNLRSLDRSGAEFESSIMSATKLSSGDIDAIQFDTLNRLNVQGFGDPGWKIVKGDEKSVRRVNGGLEMDMATALAYPSLMQSSEFSFKYSSMGFSSVRLRMFCAGTDGAKSINLLIGNTGNQFIAGMESTEGQFENQSQIRIQAGEPATVRVRIGETEVELFVNDMSLTRFPIDPARRAGSGLIIEPAGLWGNAVAPISLSDFSAQSAPGRTWLPDIAADIRTQVLTVPRFQKDDLPKHLLLAANGDVLRGEIEAATDSHFGFRCGLEHLDIPRDHVKAVIWLKPPDGTGVIASTEKRAPTPLDHWLQMRVNFGEVDLAQVMSFLRAQDGEFKFKLPDKVGPRRGPVMIGNQTIGDALATVCSRFGLRSRLDADGTVVFEPADVPPPTGNFVAKTYWLKPGALPATPAAQDILAARGIAFPKDSSAQWQPNARLLSMVNTPENQAKLAALIDSDYGGNLGSPTHWLQLTSGGRLALAVDKFQPDFILGHNPVYGACKIPMAQVYIIRTSPPDLTATIKSFADWRLVNAPEPVLPEGGGDGSPLVGKEASTFKLPLLENGSFDLAEQKGQIVVLDFWASWCGPCVKSLPGMIETVSSFPGDRVKFIGINQGESSAQVKHFLETRGLKFAVAMDADQSVAQKYGVNAIPHTVIVGPDGKVAWVETGYNPDGNTEASDVLKRLLKTPSPAPHL